MPISAPIPPHHAPPPAFVNTHNTKTATVDAQQQQQSSLVSCACSSLKLYSHPQTPSSRPHHHQHNNRTMPSKALPGPDDPSRSGWQWEKVKATMAEEYHNPAKWEANCKVFRALVVFTAGVIISRNFGEALFVS